jgi:glycerophosphoryl diester phosphodiesterase
MLNPTEKLLNRQIIAHRGASIEERENTLAAFKRAFSYHPLAIELDIQMTKDDVIVVNHDTTLSHLKGSKGALQIHQLTWYQVQMACEEAPIPTLEEVLKENRDECEIMIEIKGELCAKDKLVAELIRLLSKFKPQGISVGSIDPKYLHECKRQKMIHPLIAILDEMDDWQEFQKVNPQIYAVGDHLMTEAFAHRLVENRKRIWVWTVDEVKRAKTLLAWGVEAVITNDPGKLGGGSFGARK